MQSTPPPVLDCARVIAFASVGPSVQWTGRQTLFVDGELLGEVPNLAICKNIDSPLTDYLLFHCDNEWNVLGVSGAPNMEEVKEKAERAYKGISELWIEAHVSEEEAEQFARNAYTDSICSFCGRLPTAVEGLVQGPNVRICYQCINEFQVAINSSDQAET
jgi:hypothetical protein